MFRICSVGVVAWRVSCGYEYFFLLKLTAPALMSHRVAGGYSDVQVDQAAYWSSVYNPSLWPCCLVAAASAALCALGLFLYFDAKRA